MKQKRCVLILSGIFLCSSFVLAQANIAMAEELRPSQKIMQARAGWMKAMGESLAAMNYDGLKKDAEALAGQTKGVAEKQTDPLAKELTLKVSTLATELAGAAEKKDAAAATAKLAGIKATCGECHAKIRDKK